MSLKKRRKFYSGIVVLCLVLCSAGALHAQNISGAFETADPDTIYSQGFNRVFGLPRVGSLAAQPYLRPYSRLYYISLPSERVTVERLQNGSYLALQSIQGVNFGLPGIYTLEEYAEHTRREQLRMNWSRLIREAELSEVQGRSLLDFRFTVPGGRESAFTSIFGTPEVNLEINGVANMNVGAFIQQTGDPSLPPDQQTRIDPVFGQNLMLNIQGSIGDKLTIQTDWDTERAFDYQNRLGITYLGYEDEIIRSIELGNVSMQTGNSLIRGSGSLFGIKSVAELGPFRLTSVLSQQEGESNIETITGGSQDRPVTLSPADYEDNRHFFMDYYTRQEFEESLANPQISLQTLQFSEVNVWVMGEQVQTEEGSRLAVALQGYGVVEQPDGTYAPPDNRLDPFDSQMIDEFRDPAVGLSAGQLGLDDPRDFEEGYFQLLIEGMDYTIDAVSGYISLNRSLSSREVLAVSFTYQGSGGETVSVGDINQGGGQRIFLKMLRPANLSTDHAAFPLMMRNVYSLGATDLVRDNIELDLEFTEQSVAQNRLPGRSTTLMQDLGLDRTDSQGAVFPDNQIDFGTGTLDAVNGRIIFPYLEPFGERLEELLLDSGATGEDISRLVFHDLYDEHRQNAQRSSMNQFYRFSGTVRGGTQQNFTLDFALVEGSVRVYANGTELTEGIDYQVDYSFGSISILNDRYTAPGQEIRIEYENQSLTTIEQRTFTGLRAEYLVNSDIRFGGTYFRFNERPLDDKIRLGDEPINNMVIGFDANARFDTPFITRALDAIPLLTARAPSEVTFSGEFAQLRPDVSQTSAVNRAIRNDELYPDEVDGLSFIDDFEGSSVKINLMNPTRWFLAAAPAAIPGYDADQIYFEEEIPAPSGSPLDMQADRADMRSKFSWYTVPRNIRNILDGVEFTPETEPVRVEDVFPGMQTRDPQEEIISTLDLFFDPTRRGPYNYNMNLRTLLEDEPERTWGGMTTVLPSGQEDFSRNNVEYLEFWVQPLLPGGRDPVAGDLDLYDGRMYIDIGMISEDVIPNAKLNSEDGLALNPESLVPDRPVDPRSFIPSNPPPPEGEFSLNNRDLEDVGLDGLPVTGGINGLNERNVFSDFLASVEQQYGAGSPEYLAAWNDPSNDNYLYYGESGASGLPLHERFHRMMGYYEGNTPIERGDRQAVTNRPNTEGLVNPSRVQLNNAYFQYELDFNPSDLSGLSPASGSYIVDQVSGSRPGDRWFQVRIPLDDFSRKVGDIEDFQNITYVRLWMSGYERPFTLRFATLDFVGSQWQHAERLNNASDPAADLSISTINIEENSNRRPIPYRQPRGAIRAQQRGTQMQSLQNEQSIVLSVENLGAGNIQMVRRNYPGGLNLLNYSNMRMFVHGEGYQNRGDAELVLRFGNDLENHYYEYRQLVTPSDVDYPFQSYDPGDGSRMEEEASQVWLYDENSMNIILRAFNQLKQLRDLEAPEDHSLPFERSGLLEDAPPGAVIALRGSPSLDRVNEIGMGIRNPYNPENPSGSGQPVLNARFWLNELRVSGFDNEPGWAANARSSVRLSDFATLNTHLVRQTDGFGALDSRLGQRRVSDQLAYDINSTVNMHQFIPERYGWSIPVNLSTRRSTLTPRYLPHEGDVRVQDFMDAVRSRSDISGPEKEALISRRIHDMQTYSEFYSINFSNITKSNSEGWLTRYTLDNTTFNYVFNTSRARSPQYNFQDGWNFNSSVRYSHTFRSVHYVRPFGFLENIPLAGMLSGLELGLMPNNFTTSIRMNRQYEERRRRVAGPEVVQQPLQQTHNFNYNTTVGFGYNLTRSITTNFQAQGGFDLSRAGQRNAGLSGADSVAVEILPSLEVLQNVVEGFANPRRSTYQEAYTASWQPRLDHFRPLNWVFYTLHYGGGYRWENSPFQSDMGSRVSNTFRLDHTLRLETGRLLERWTVYSSLAEADREERREREARREGEGRDEMDRLSLEDHLRYYSRRILLGIVSFQSVEISYNEAKTGSQAGYAGGSQLIDMFGWTDGYSPSFLYRLGYREQMGYDRLIGNPGGVSAVQLPATNTYSDDINLRTRLLPFSNFSIDLTWVTHWDERTTESISISPDDQISAVRSASGNVGSSVWAFGSGYRSLFERQLQTAFDDISPFADSIRTTGTGTVLNRSGLQEDFRNSYLGAGDGALGERNYTPFPMPNWRINWMGIENMLPFVGRYMQRATLVHGYTGRYRLGWLFNNDPGPLPPRRVGAYVVEDIRSEFEPMSINIEHRFSPLIQLNVTWDSNLRTQVGYEYSKLTSMALSNMNVTERISRGLTLSATYTIRNFRIPFFRTLSNNLDVTVNGNYIEDTEQRFLLASDIERALSEGHETINMDPSAHTISPREPAGQTRINSSAILGYRFSNTLQANFQYAFGVIMPKSSRTFQRTTHDIRFNLRINFRAG